MMKSISIFPTPRQIMSEKLIELLLVIIAVLSPIVPALLVTLYLIGTDFILGIWAAIVKREKGEPWYRTIKSRKLSHTISKLLLYNIAIITAFVIETFATAGFIPFSKLVFGLICLTEAKSVFEKIHKITNVDLYQKILNQLKRKEDE